MTDTKPLWVNRFICGYTIANDSSMVHRSFAFLTNGKSVDGAMMPYSLWVHHAESETLWSADKEVYLQFFERQNPNSGFILMFEKSIKR